MVVFIAPVHCKIQEIPISVLGNIPLPGKVDTNGQ